MDATPDRRGAAELREDAEAMAAAAADTAAQISQIDGLGQTFLTLAADTAHGPIRVTLPTRAVTQTLGARLASLDGAASALRREALAMERDGTHGAAIRAELGFLARGLGQG